MHFGLSSRRRFPAEKSFMNLTKMIRECRFVDMKKKYPTFIDETYIFGLRLPSQPAQEAIRCFFPRKLWQNQSLHNW